MIRSFFIFVCILLSGVACTKREELYLVCEVREAVVVNHSNLDEAKIEVGDTKYLFKNNTLYVLSSSMSPYEYGEFKKVERNKFYVGHKIINFEEDYNEGVMVHVSSLDTVVSQLNCKKTPQ